MNTYPKKIGLGREVLSWLENLGYRQALHILTCLAKTLEFSKENGDFFQGCGLYVVGSSLTGGNFNDVDIVLVGLDFRAVVSYDKIFLMDPETLIKKRILVEPQLFAVIDRIEDGKMLVCKPVTAIDSRNLFTCIHQFNHMGLEYNGKKYDYNFKEHSCLSSDLIGYCSNHAGTSKLTKKMNKLFNPDDEFSENLSHPFDQYSFGGAEPFLVYRISIRETNSDLPVAKDSIIEEVKPIDFSIHAENLLREEWKRHQASLRLPYLTLKEWRGTNRVRKIITELDYPAFIDPNGAQRAERNLMSLGNYDPGETPDTIKI